MPRWALVLVGMKGCGGNSSDASCPRVKLEPRRGFVGLVGCTLRLATLELPSTSQLHLGNFLPSQLGTFEISNFQRLCHLWRINLCWSDSYSLCTHSPENSYIT